MTVPARIKEWIHLISDAPDEEFDLLEGSLALAAMDHPKADFDACRARFDEIAAAMDQELNRHPQLAHSLDGRQHCINRVLFDQLSYVGSESDQVLCAPSMIDTLLSGSGLPVSLGILYLHAARSQGWEAHGIAFPSPFMVRLCRGSQRRIVLPFCNGITMTARDLRTYLKALLGDPAELKPYNYDFLSDRNVLLRLQNHQKLNYLRQDKMNHMLSAVEASLIIAPDRRDLWQEKGMVNARLGRLPDAIEALETYLQHATEDAEHRRTAMLLQQLYQQQQAAL